MSNSKEIIDALIKEDLYTAKKLINEDLVARMGDALETKLMDFGPTLFGEGLKGDQHKIDANKNGKVDAEDFKLLKNKKKKMNEESEIIAEDFENQLKSLVEEIEEETGEQLSEEEIMDIANQLLDILSEEQEEDEDEDEGDEEETEETPKAKKGFNPRNTGGDAY
ncbi:MAG: hypothetical protein ACOYNN_04715 [Terrimicrobiaceae bacterium]|jgi:hypothetical protein